MTEVRAKIKLPPKLIEVFAPPRGELRYRGAYGGRGSGKSFNFAKMAAIWGAIEPLRILATREYQNSIKDSFHAELKNAIRSEDWLECLYDVGENYIKGINGTEFIFSGLRNNIQSIKSMAQIDLCIIEEAEDVPERSWLDLNPTIRASKSEIWVIWNPKIDGSPVDKRFIKSQPERSKIVELNYEDNPWFPCELEEERLQARKRLDDDMYHHIWEGGYLTRSDAQVFANKWQVDDFTPADDWHGPYFGLDFGFAQDPTAAVKCWVFDECLYIEYEAGKVGLELDHTSKFMTDRVPGIDKHVVRADSARPESISYLKRKGIPKIIGVKKGKGSVEDGIEHIKSYKKVIIHSRCCETIQEFRQYSYKVDRLTGDIQPTIIDAYNHYIDAIRYALEPLIKPQPKIYIG